MLRLLAWFTLEQRRNRLRVRLIEQQEYLKKLHPEGFTRKLNLQKERELLRRTFTQLVSRLSIAGCDEIEQILGTSRTRCDDMMQEETQLRARLYEADAKAGRYRELAAGFPSKSFSEDARRKRKIVAAEVKSFWRAKDQQIEQRMLAHIEAQAAALEHMVMEAQDVQKAVTELKAELARLPKDQIAVNIGSEEIFHEINATFVQVQADATRGNYHKAHQGLTGLNELKEGLVAGLDRRRIEARQQVELWLDCAAVMERFPEIPAFPARMSALDVEKWYALRPSVEEVVLKKASEQRARNVPSRHFSHFSGYKLTADHPLRASLEDASNDAKLEAYLRAAKMYG